MKELKAEQMLSILTAAETEMYESSKKNDELQQRLIASRNVPTEDKSIAADILSEDSNTVKAELREYKDRAVRSENEISSLH